MLIDFLNNWDRIMTVVFAGLSACFAGLSFLVLWLEYKRNNADIVVRMCRGFAMMGNHSKEFAVCSIVNRGRRPVCISKFEFLLKNGQVLFLVPGRDDLYLETAPKFPFILEETHKLEFSIHLSDLVESFQTAPAKVKALSFSDTAGNSYVFNIKKKFWREFF